jgi:hypothetical protein
MSKISLTEKQNIVNPLADGVHYDAAIGEHKVIVGGVVVNYATHWSTAVNQFKEASRARREHLRNHPQNATSQLAY